MAKKATKQTNTFDQPNTFDKQPPAFIEPVEPTADDILKVRDGLRKMRDLKMDIDERSEALKEVEQNYKKMERETIPQLFAEAGIARLDLEAEGNYPAFVAERQPYYHASIAQSWDDDKRKAAFDALTKAGGGPLIKSIITIELERGDVELRKRVTAGLDKAKIPYSIALSVPWKSLTSFVKELVEKRKTMPPKEIAADVGEIIKLKPRKEK